MPPEQQISALQEGDLVQIIFRSVPPGLEFGAERMWVIITEHKQGMLKGTLDNDPSDLPQLKHGEIIEFRPYHVIDIQSDRAQDFKNAKDSKKQYWDQCFVDDCVLNDGEPVGYLYREKPDMGQEDDKYPDSGWRIRGDLRNLSDNELAERSASYIALGKVLNKDDSWIHLIDSPAGSAFERDFETGEYFPLED